MLTKKKLRNKYLKIRQSQPKTENLSNSKRVRNNFFEIIPNSDKRILTYFSNCYEVRTRSLNLLLIKNNHEVYGPSIDADGNIFPIKIDENYKLELNRYNVLQPDTSCYNESIEPVLIDYVIIPGIVFSMDKYRIGFGKGCYDKFLKKLSSDTKKIGLAFDFQLIEKIPLEKHDIPLDVIVTETKIF